MKTNQLLTICGIAAALFLSAGSVSAQAINANAGGNPDPAQQRFLTRIHDGLGFTDETQWGAVQPLVQNVFNAQRDLASANGLSRMPLVNRTNGLAHARSARAIFLGQPSPEAQALQSAIDANASDDQIDAALTAYQVSQKAKRAKLVEAQETLRKALNKKQEAQATLLRLLD